MKKTKYFASGLDCHFYSHGHENKPWVEFRANGVKEGFFVSRIGKKPFAPSKATVGHQKFPLCNSFAEAMESHIKRLKAEGQTGVFAFRDPDSGNYTYRTI